MNKPRINTCLTLAAICIFLHGCKTPTLVNRMENKHVPADFGSNNTSGDTTNIAARPWQSIFTDPYLVQLIDTALSNNQELNSTFQEIVIARNEIRMRKGALLPFVGVRGGLGVEKVGRYTSQGAGDASTDITDGTAVPDVLPDYTASIVASWEIDIWKKLHNAKKAAINRYLATIEGRNFMRTQVIAEVATGYYELLSLDNQLSIVKQTIALQKNALEIVKVQKEAARTTELAVQKFQAEVLSSQSLEFEILQKIKEAENDLNLLLGRFPQEILRDKDGFQNLNLPAIPQGIPSQLLANRPDVRQAELALAAARLDVKVARAEFYPSLNITAAAGLQAFNPSFLLKLPESLLYSLVGDLAGPLINRNAIKAEYYSANARQLQSVFNYERTLLNAYLEVSTQLSKMENLRKSYDLKTRQVAALNRSIDVSNDLFKSARVDYFEVLMTQRDALEARLGLVETQQEQLNAVVAIYKDLGGGWR